MTTKTAHNYNPPKTLEQMENKRSCKDDKKKHKN